MNVSDYAAMRQDAFKVKAGTVVAVNDLLELGPDGRAYPVECSDYAAVANCTYGTPQTTIATGMVVAQTQVVSGQTIAPHRQALLQGVDGSLYATTLATTTGIMLTRYSASGALISQVVAISTGVYENHQAFFLSNGNICVIAGSPDSTISFAIYDPLLNPVKAVTALSQTQRSSCFSSCALTGGGFAVIYQYSTTQLESKFVTYDNTGTVVTAPVTVWARTGTSGIQYHRLMLLSSGNLAVAVHSNNTVSSIGLFYAVLSPTGTIVKAFTNLIAVSGGSYIPELSVMSGYFVVSKADGTNVLAFVFDDAGNLQGSGFSAATTINTAQNQLKLLNNGTDFWLLWSRSTDSKVCLTKIPITGTGYTTTVVTTTTTQYDHYFDAFAENGLIVAVSLNGTTSVSPVLWVISQATGFLISTSATAFGVNAVTANGTKQKVIPVGDFAFACLYDYSSPVSTNLAVGKYANTAVLGVANTSAAANTLVSTSQKAGGYAINAVKGSTSKAFDHSATNIIGNKGTIMNYGAVLKGI